MALEHLERAGFSLVLRSNPDCFKQVYPPG